MTPITPASPQTSTSKSTRLVRFINDLSLRPNDPPYDLNEPNPSNVAAVSSGPLPSAQSITSFSITGSSHHLAPTTKNPESDSFAYIETLLESMAVLGKLGSALDIVAQRVSKQLFSVVETTLDEVEERAEYGRRGSIFLNVGPGGSNKLEGDGVYMFVSDVANAAMSMSAPGGLLSASSLRLTALESSAKRVDHETLNDFFWTLYSKLDAVTQGLRVVYEVANRIGSVSNSRLL